MPYQDPKRDTPPTPADPATKALFDKFMNGDIDTTNHQGRRYVYDGKKDKTTPAGIKRRSVRHRSQGVKKRGGITK